MKSDARNIIIGIALIGIVAIGGWILKLQKENKNYNRQNKDRNKVSVE